MALFVCTGNKGKIQEYRDYLGQHAGLVSLPEVEKAVGHPFPEPVEDYDHFMGNALLKLFSCLEFVATAPRSETPCDITEILVDDSGLCVPALNLEPGVHSAYYGGLPRDAEKNRVALRKAIGNRREGVRGEARLDSFFVCFLLTLKVNADHLKWARTTPGLARSFSTPRAEDVECQLMMQASDAVALPNVSGNHHSLALRLGDFFPEQPFPLCNDTAHLHFGYCIGEVSTEEQTLIPDAGHGYDCLFYARQHPDLSFASIPLDQKNRESHRALAMKSLTETTAHRS